VSAIKSTPRAASPKFAASRLADQSRHAWMDDPDLACADDDTLFFHPEGERGGVRRRRAEKAKAVCRTCPFADACRDLARTNREPYGTWGGESEDERQAWLTGKPIPQPQPRQPRVRTIEQRPALVVALVVVPPPAVARARECIIAPEVIEHLRLLVEAGATRRQIAEAAALSPGQVGKILRGEFAAIRRGTAAALLSVRVRSEEAAA